jgi:uncharacterized radical SAM superfamily Fe-S cluster-containing enzyme
MENLLKTTKGFCPQCLDIVTSEIFERQGSVFIRKTCARDGSFEMPYFWRDLDCYKTMQTLYGSNQNESPIARLIYLNRKCNQHCNFCFANAIYNEEGTDAPQNIDDIIAGLDSFKGQYIYLCGGEPTLRKDLPEIIYLLKKRGFTVILMSNGKKLVDLNFVKKLARAGLDIVQLQFDTLNDKQYNTLRNESLLETKLKVINNLRQVKISVQLWVMLVKSVNEDQIEPIIRFAAQNVDIVKTVFFISSWKMGRFISCQEITKEEIMAVIEKRIGITKSDFISYTAFDYYLSKIYYGLMNRTINRSSPCNLDCHLFVNGGIPIPLSRIIDLDAINNSLKKIHTAMTNVTPLNKIKILSVLAIALTIKQLILNKRLFIFSVSTLFYYIVSFFRKSYPINKHNNSFHIRIGSFVDIVNSDLDIFRHCNIFSDDTGAVQSFCLNEIVKERQGRLKCT